MNNTMERKINREVLLFAVQRKIFCDVTGQILDIRDAVLVTGEKDGKTVVNLCMTGKAWTEGEDIVRSKALDLGVELEILNGKDLA